MNLNRFFFQPTLSIATAVVTTCVAAAPSQAYNLVFSEPNVLVGINGVAFTLPSTGLTRTYNATLERGTVTDVFGAPPKFDVLNQIDAGAVMNASAQGINSFLFMEPGEPELWFESVGTNVFYLPYGIDPDSGNVLASSSVRKPKPTGVDPGFIALPPDDDVVYVHLTPVPEPTFTIGLLALGTLGAASTLKRKLKPSSEKEITKVG